MILDRVREKIARIWFFAWHRRLFRKLEQGAYMVAPFRLDGPSSMEIGAGTFIQRGSWLYCDTQPGQSPMLKLGQRCVLGYNNHITCVRSVYIGNDVLTANNVYISDNSHGYEDVTRPIMQQPVVFKGAVYIGDGSWIGENVAIIGVRVGKNCVIGANSVVTHDIPDFSVAAGAPARVIRQYEPAAQTWT